MKGIHLESSSVVKGYANHLSVMGNAFCQGKKTRMCREIINMTDKGKYIHITEGDALQQLTFCPTPRA